MPWRRRKVFLARWRIALVMVDRVLFFDILRQCWWKIVGVGRLVLLQAV